jgi:hypothetical protein
MFASFDCSGRKGPSTLKVCAQPSKEVSDIAEPDLIGLGGPVRCAKRLGAMG